MTTPAAPEPFKIKANDRRPSIQVTLGYQGSAAVPSLTGCTVQFIMRAKDAKTNLPAVGSAAKVAALAIIVDALTGKVRYDWAAGDTSIPGAFLAEWEVTDAEGLTQTFPTDGYNDVLIYADLDGAA